MTEQWLLADLGGTNTRVGLATPSGLITDSARSYANAEYSGLATLLAAYLADMGRPTVSALCAGVAGPVRGAAAQLTNHSWFIDSADLTSATGAGRVILINDLQAQGYALDDLTPDSVTPLFAGATAPKGATRLVLGLGTGCNIAVVHDTTTGLLVPPSESGHSSLPACDGDLADLITHLAETHPHRPIECALSGPGLQNIWRFLGGAEATPAKIIEAQAAGDRMAGQAIELFAQLLGKAAGDLALTHLPMGGLYLIGGMARAIAPHLQRSGFHDAFTAKGPYASIMRDIPIRLITDDLAALHGCARCLRQSQLTG